MMIKKIVTGILSIIFVCGALSEILSWLNITPKQLTNSKSILVLQNFLNFKIPLYIVSLIVLIIIITLFKIFKKNRQLSRSSEIKHKEEKQEKEEINLSKEQKYLLLFLLEQSNRSFSRYQLENKYKEVFSKTTSDFNIIEYQLKGLDLIGISHYPSGTYWVLTKKGLRLASIIHSQIKSN